jgi:hypothetical protein
MRLLLQRTKPFTFIDDNFPLEIGSLICSKNSYLLLADSRNWHTAANLFDFQRETYFCYWFNANERPLD